MRSIRHTVALALAGTSAALLCLTAAIQYLVVFPSFVKLEREFAIRNAERCVDALHREIQLLSDNSHDWAAWDDAYQYVQDRNRVFEAANLENSLEATHVHFLAFFAPNGEVIWSRVESPTDRSPLKVPDLVARLSEPGSIFRGHRTWTDGTSGVVLTSRGPMLIASRPVVDSARKARPRGTLVMGVFCDHALMRDLADRTHVDVAAFALPDGVPAADRPALGRLSRAGAVHIEERGNERLDAYALIRDAWKEPALLLRVRMPRPITTQGRTSAWSATLCAFGGSFVALVVIWLLLQKTLVTPLRRLADHAANVGRNGNLAARTGLARDDEIGVVAREFDGMTAALAEAQDRMIATAHKAGMADVASDVLHNVGNALSSATCSADLLDEHLREPRSRGLANAVKLLKSQAESGRLAEFFAADPRGPKLVDYLAGLEEAVRTETDENRAEVERLRNTLRHIREAIALQQTYARRTDFRQDVDLCRLADEVLAVHVHELRASGIRVEREFTSLPPVSVNKPKLVQVLVNLVRNAIQSITESGGEDRRLTVRVRADELGLPTVEVGDTGIGIDDAARPRLFTHGFTTKESGNGFGLHYCANAVREMGGDIAAESEGPGRGATFRVRLPRAEAAMAV